MKTKEQLSSNQISRRDVLRLGLFAGVGAFLASCTVVIPEGGLPITVVTATPNGEHPPTPKPVETLAPAKVLFDEDPRSASGQTFGDGGFRTECSFGDQPCATNLKITWGPFARELGDPTTPGVIGNGTYRVTIWGEGTILAGATDSRMYNGDWYGLTGGPIEGNLSTGPLTYEFYWPGMQYQSNGELNGYGMEYITQQGNGNPARVSRIKVELVGPGNLTH